MTNYSQISEKDISLRDYQQSAKESIFRLWDDFDNILYQMPTGTGKTRLFTSLIRDIRVWSHRFSSPAKILIVAHRTELIDQIDKSLNKYHISHGIIAGGMKTKRDLTLPVQVASIQTITHPSNAAIAGDFAFNFIIIDEAHHATAMSYTKLWNLYPESKKLGVTASPWRMNNGGFKPNFDTLLLSMPIKEFMDKGWLASYEYYSIPANTELRKDLEDIKDFDIEGDYKISALEKVIDTENIRSRLVESYLALAKGKKGIIYSISKKHSENICHKYRTIGVEIVSIDSETPSKIRERYVNDFKNGKIDIIVNVDIFSEGFDCPDIEFIQLARPTKSLVKYIQQVGRGLRRNGNKKCIILDNVGLYLSFGFPDADHPWQTYFEGVSLSESMHKSEPSNSININEREPNLNEGNDEMVLLQCAKSETAEICISDIEPKLDDIQDLETTNADATNNPTTEHSILPIRSKSFSKGNFAIELNRQGYHLINLRTQETRLLKENGYQEGGSIRLVHDRINDVYTIIRILKSVNRNREMIVGYLIREGGILRFSLKGY